MTCPQLLSTAGVLSCIGAIAVVDARKRIIDPLLLALLLAFGVLWRVATGADTVADFILAVLTAFLGAAVILVPIAYASWRGRRWPVFPGDAMMLAAFGFLLGPLAFGWALLAGSMFSLLHRVWLQRRRGRSVRAGFCPMAPGMAAGAAAVFLYFNTGIAIAAPMTATELLPPPSQSLPERLVGKRVSLVIAKPTSFSAVLGRVSRAAGASATAEDRPARVLGGERDLPPAAPMTISFTGPLPDLLDRIAERSGHAWTWRDGAILFYRYRDSEQTVPPTAPKNSIKTVAAVPAAREGQTPPDPALGPWIVDPERHPTLRATLSAWSRKAGWSLVWKPERSYAVTASARFDGGFLDAVDRLIAAPAIRGALAAVAYRANRYLVIGDAGTIRP